MEDNKEIEDVDIRKLRDYEDKEGEEEWLIKDQILVHGKVI